ncbi:MAG: hypothetical protein K9N10_11370 [Deltaproteobacteria bacterium]|nr:hypothetical protein [Deltaproteobacteria bacterium]
MFVLMTLKDTHHRRPSKTLSGLWKVSNTHSPHTLPPKYVSFGKPFGRGAVWRPSGFIEWKGIGFNVWSNFVINRGPKQGQFNEVDLTLYYDVKIENLTIVAPLNGRSEHN